MWQYLDDFLFSTSFLTAATTTIIIIIILYKAVSINIIGKSIMQQHRKEAGDMLWRMPT